MRLVYAYTEGQKSLPAFMFQKEQPEGWQLVARIPDADWPKMLTVLEKARVQIKVRYMADEKIPAGGNQDFIKTVSGISNSTEELW